MEGVEEGDARTRDGVGDEACLGGDETSAEGVGKAEDALRGRVMDEDGQRVEQVVLTTSQEVKVKRKVRFKDMVRAIWKYCYLLSTAPNKLRL